MSPSRNTPGTRLAAILEEEGRTQKWLARRVGEILDVKPPDRAQVSRWVAGAVTPATLNRRAIAQALGQDVDSLFPAQDTEKAA